MSGTTRHCCTALMARPAASPDRTAAKKIRWNSFIDVSRDLVAGEAERVAHVVRAIVDGHVAGKTDAADEDEADEQGQHTCGEPLRDRKRCDCRRLGRGRH